MLGSGEGGGCTGETVGYCWVLLGTKEYCRVPLGTEGYWVALRGNEGTWWYCRVLGVTLGYTTTEYRY